MAAARPSTADKRRPSASCTSPAASSFPIRGTSAARAICRASASRRWRSTSSGHAHSEGYADGAQSLDECWRIYREIAAATDIPLNADFENGYADDPDERRRERDALHRDRRRRAVDRGFAAEATSRSTTSIWRSRASRRRAPRSTRPAATWCSPRAPRASSAAGPTSTRPSARLKAFADAGADCLYSPGIKTREQIEATVKAVGAEGDQLPQQRRVRLHGERPRRHGRAAHQRRRLARARGDACLHQDRDARSPRTASSTASPDLITNAELNKFFGEDRKTWSCMSRASLTGRRSARRSMPRRRRCPAR